MSPNLPIHLAQFPYLLPCCLASLLKMVLSCWETFTRDLLSAREPLLSTTFKRKRTNSISRSASWPTSQTHLVCVAELGHLVSMVKGLKGQERKRSLLKLDRGNGLRENICGTSALPLADKQGTGEGRLLASRGNFQPQCIKRSIWGKGE